MKSRAWKSTVVGQCKTRVISYIANRNLIDSATRGYPGTACAEEEKPARLLQKVLSEASCLSPHQPATHVHRVCRC